MEYIKINRLRGEVADFTWSSTGMRISFAGKQSKNPPVDLTEEQCKRLLNELTEALEVFYVPSEDDDSGVDSGSNDENTQENDGTTDESGQTN